MEMPPHQPPSYRRRQLRPPCPPRARASPPSPLLASKPWLCGVAARDLASVKKKQTQIIQPANRRFRGVIAFCPPSLRPTRTVVRGHIEDALERRMMPRMQRMGVVGAKKCRLRIFWAWWQRRAALDRHTPLRGHGKSKKRIKQQSTNRWRRVEAPKACLGPWK